jgi:hypothetical protein
MKTRLIIMISLLISSALCAQEIKNNKESKSEKASRIEKEYMATERLIDSSVFVLSADFLSNQSGYRVMVEPMLNFIKIDSSQVVIQTGNNVGIGYNGVGGLTVQGKITNWIVRKDLLHKSFSIRMSISSSLGYYDVYMNVTASGKAFATLSGNYSGKLMFEGRLFPVKEVRTFQGSNI